MRGAVRTYVHTNRLIELVAVQGGKTSEEAIADANRLVSSLRSLALEGIEAAIGSLEECVQAGGSELGEEEMQHALSCVDRIVMLADLFEFHRLLKVSSSLGALVASFSALGAGPVEPIAVHVRAARLFSPTSRLLPEADAQKVFAELSRVLKHFAHRPPVPPGAFFRQSLLDQLNPADRSPQEPFERLTRLASLYFNAPISLVSLLDRNRLCSMPRCGLDVVQTDCDIAPFAHAIMTEELMVVLDATKDARLAANPLVLNEPYVRFFAAAPLIGPDGSGLGTFCIIDIEARQKFSERDRGILRNFAERTVAMIYSQVLDSLSRLVPGENLKNSSESGWAVWASERLPS